MDLALREPGRGREADLDLAVGGELDRLLALLHAVEVELDDAAGGLGALRRGPGP